MVALRCRPAGDLEIDRLVRAGPLADALAGFRRGPWGWVDERGAADGVLSLRGWAASLDDGVLPAIDVRVDGVHHACPTGLPRPDVRDAFADERLLRSGWEFRLPLAGAATAPWVEVEAHSARGETALLYVGLPRK